MSRRPWISGEALLLAALIAVHLLPIWLLPYFPSQDGPAHLAVANILREYSRPEGAVLREYYELNRDAVPNLFVHFVLADLLRFVPVPVAEKIFLSAYVMLLPLAARYAVRGVEPRNAFLAVLAVPFTYNLLLGLGFYNFCFSLVAFFLAFGYWLRQQGPFGPVQVMAFAGMALWVYFAHPVSLVALLAAVGAAAGWRAFVDLREGEPKRAMRRLAGPLLGALPAMALLISFGGSLGAERVYLPLPERLRKLAALASLVSYDMRMQVLSALLAGVLACLAVWLLLQRLRKESLGPADGLLVAVAALILLNLFTPDTVGIGSFITDRLHLFPYLMLILWLASFDHSALRRRGLQLLAAGVALGMLGFLVPRWRELNSFLAEYLSAAEWIEPGRTLLPLSFAHAGERPNGEPLVERVLPFVHAAGHIAARKPVADLALFAAKYDAFPVRFQPERNPYRVLLRGGELKLDFPAETGGRIDYVLLWWPEAKTPSFGRKEEVLRQLASGWNRIYTSPRGLAELYRSGNRERATGARAAPTVR